MTGPSPMRADSGLVAVEFPDSTGPVVISSCTSRILRLRIGAEGQRQGYLPERNWPDAPPLRTAGDVIRGGDVVLRLDEDTKELVLSDGHGTPSLRIGVRYAAGRLRISCHIAGEQHFFGLGHGGGALDRLGATRRLWTAHVNHGNGADIPVPVLFSHRGYGLFFDNASEATITPDKSYRTSWLNYETGAPAIDVYLLVGKDLRDATSAFADLLGYPAMPPRWLLGFLQSTRHFRSAEEVTQVAAELRKRRLPCDGLIFLSTYGAHKGWNKGVGHLEWQPDIFPDPEKTVRSLRENGFRVLLHEYPVVHPDAPLHAEGAANDYLLAETYPAPAAGEATPDNYRENQNYIAFANPAAARWWWDRHRPLAALGIDGWWLDGGEGPTAHTEGDGNAAPGLHNRFDLLRQQAFCEGETLDRPERRPVMLCRSGGPGMQRFGAACWSGDINGSFETLERQVPLALSAAMSGLAYWGSDVGGFYTRSADEEELFIRWIQFGAFCPIFRLHGRDWRNRLPWSHGERAEAICRDYLELRYRLLPYNYTLAWQAHMSGLPLMRPLVLNYPEDMRAWEIDRAFLWGDDLLIAPVTREKATRWPVYLPAGTWHDFWTGKSFTGPCTIEADAPLERIPVFVRGGSIIPMALVRQHTGAGSADEMTLLIHPDETATGILYEDSGDGHDHLSGRSLLTTFSARRTENSLTVSIDSQEGDTSLQPEGRHYRVRIRLDADPLQAEAGSGPHTVGNAIGVPWQRDGAYIVTAIPAGNTWVRLNIRV